MFSFLPLAIVSSILYHQIRCRSFRLLTTFISYVAFVVLFYVPLHVFVYKVAQLLLYGYSLFFTNLGKSAPTEFCKVKFMW